MAQGRSLWERFALPGPLSEGWHALRVEQTMQIEDGLIGGGAFAFALHRDGDGRYTVRSVSEGFEVVTGVAPGEVASLWGELSPQAQARLLAGLERSAAALTRWRDDAHTTGPRGRGRAWELRATPSREGEGVTWRGLCVDASDRAAEVLARDAHDLVRQLFSQAPASLAILDRELRYLATTARWDEDFGGGASPVGRSHHAMFPDLKESWRRAHQEGLEGRVSVGDVDLWTREDGTRQWLRWAVHPWRDARGDVGGIIISTEDITARREVEEALRASEARLAGILQSAMDGIITVDGGDRVIYSNAAAARMFGVEPGALDGTDLCGLLPVAVRADHAGWMRAFADTGITHRPMGRSTVTGVRRDGSEFPLEASISQVVVQGQRLFTVVVRDVSRRVEAERRLSEQEARFRQLTDSIREVFWLTDIEKREVLYISPAYETVWGRSCASLLSDARSWLASIHPDDRDRVAREGLPRQPQGTYDEVYRVVRPDGSVRWVHDRAFPVRDASGAVVRIAGVAEDVTEQRLLQAQLQQTQKMESVGRLAGGVAHDFNNLLTVIVSAAEMLRDEPDNLDDRDELVESVLDAARRGASLTRQLLAFTRQEIVEPRVMDLGAVVVDTERLLRRLIGEDIRLTTQLQSAWAPVRIDPGQWTQVLLNLAVNARDAMPDGGRLDVATGAEEVDAATAAMHPGLTPGSWATLTVRDTGCGMTPEVRARVFDPFFTTKPRGHGTGLGLAVVYGVVQQSDGHIEVESVPQEGTTFRIYLPAAAEGARASVVSVATGLRGGHEVVLLVEDEDAVRRVAARVLSSRGYQVLTAADGEHARQVLDAHGGVVDLLLTDVVLPRLDGPAVAEMVRARHPRAAVLFASGYIDDAVTRRGVVVGESNFLQKPYSPTILLQRVRELLDARRG